MMNDIFTRAQDWRYLVIAPSGDNEDAIRKANPFKIDSFLKKFCTGESLREVKAINMGRQLLVVVKNKETADVLMKQISIPGSNNSSIPVKITESDRLGTKQGVFFCRNTEDMTDEEIINNLNESNSDMKITAIRRLKKRNTEGKWVDSGSHVITMRCNQIPKEIRVGWMIQTIRPYIPDPMRCFRCNKLGHTGKRCRERKEEEKNCINCNMQQHTAPGSKCENEPYCANCLSTQHNSAFRGCPSYILDKSINEIMVTRGLTRREATAVAKNEPTPTNLPKQPTNLAQRLKNAISTPKTQQSEPSTSQLPQKTLPSKKLERIPLPENSDIEMTTEEQIKLKTANINLLKQKISEKKRHKSTDSTSSEEGFVLSNKQIKKIRKTQKAEEARKAGQPPGKSSDRLDGQGKGVANENKNNLQK